MTRKSGRLYQCLMVAALLLWTSGQSAFAQGQVIEDSKRISLSSREENGLNQITFTTGNGNVIALLPAEIVAGDNIWGTVVLAPVGQTATDRQNSFDALKRLFVQVKAANGAAVVMVPGCSPKALRVPNDCSEIQVSLCDPASKTMNTYIVDCLLNRPVNNSGDKVAIPQVATPKRFFPCGANTSGNPGSVGCSINGENCPAVAGGPRNQWFAAPTDMPAGQQPIKVYLPEKNQVAESQISMVRPKIQADKLMRVGERGQIRITVDGLKPGTDAQLIFRNLSPQVISVDGGDYQVIPLSGK